MIKNFLDSNPKIHAAAHAVLPVVVSIAPTLLSLMPAEWANLTLSGAILLVLHWAENNV